MCGCSTRRTYKVIVPHLRTSIVFAQQSRTKNPKAPAKVLFGSINAWLAQSQYKKDLQSNHFPTKQYNSYKKTALVGFVGGCCFCVHKGFIIRQNCALFTVGTQMFTASSDCAVCGTISAKRACCCDTNIFLID